MMTPRARRWRRRRREAVRFAGAVFFYAGSTLAAIIGVVIVLSVLP